MLREQYQEEQVDLDSNNDDSKEEYEDEDLADQYHNLLNAGSDNSASETSFKIDFLEVAPSDDEATGNRDATGELSQCPSVASKQEESVNHDTSEDGSIDNGKGGAETSVNEFIETKGGEGGDETSEVANMISKIEISEDPKARIALYKTLICSSGEKVGNSTQIM